MNQSKIKNQRSLTNQYGPALTSSATVMAILENQLLHHFNLKNPKAT